MIVCKFTEVGTSQPATLFEKEVVKCFCCDKELVECVTVTEIEKPEEKWVFKCPFCGEQSLTKKYKNKLFFNPIKCKLENVEKEGDTWVVKLH